MKVLTVQHHNLTRIVTDVELVDHLLVRGGVSLYRRLQVRQSGQVREWLDAGHSVDEMLSLARVGDTSALAQMERSA